MTTTRMPFSRRNIIALGAMAATGLAGSVLSYRSAFGTSLPERGLSPSFAPFSVPMPIPPVLRPHAVHGNTDLYRLAVKQAHVEILPGTTTPVFGYGGAFVGPTILARSGRKVGIVFDNSLDRATNVHLHGGHVAAASDGHPMDLIQSDSSKYYEYENRQQGATLWYHDHSHGTEAEHVYRGLSGFYLIQDPEEEHLRLPCGSYDVPIMLRDALFDDHANMVYGDPTQRPTVLVNGAHQPYFRVARRKYRFRFLNAATERRFALNLDGVPMTKIGSDGGLLASPVPVTEHDLSAGERVEFVIDFGQHPIGTQLLLADGTLPILRFDVVADSVDHSRLPDRLRALPPLPRPRVNREITLSFDMSGDPVGLVNGKPFDPARVDFRVRRGDTEIWNVSNGDGEHGFHHNFHLHLEQFEVLDRDGAPPWESDRGLKDTIYVPPGSSARLKTRFTDYLGKYVYHCHFLEHSAVGMMAQFEVVR